MMSFPSFSFFGFAFLVLLVYWILPHKARKVFLLAASCLFYILSMPSLSPILFSSIGISYFAARGIERYAHNKGRGKQILTGACILHFGLLFVFKYLQMTLDLAYLVLPAYIHPAHLSLILPIGISFYTFTLTGYLFDVYRGKIRAEHNFIDYALFVSFFPCILAGPINRARDFLPQLKKPIPFHAETLKMGVLRFLFGLMQKLVLADNLGAFIDRIYGGETVSPLTWIAAILLYGLQIYFDFSGYSHMSIGLAQAFGLHVPENFQAPYFAVSLTDFWKRWHISLTSWFREYLYFPLGGSRKGKMRTYLNILIVFSVSGLWHGAGLHYVLWGLINGALQIVERLTAGLRGRLEGKLRRPFPRLVYKLLCIAVTYCLVSFTWIFFRAENSAQALSILGQVFSGFRSGFGALSLTALGLNALLCAVLLCAALLLLGGICAATDLHTLRGKDFSQLGKRVLPYYLVVAALVVIIALFGVYGEGFDPQDFVYFRY